jgi:hypothetical protein
MYTESRNIINSVTSKIYLTHNKTNLLLHQVIAIVMCEQSFEIGLIRIVVFMTWGSHGGMKMAVFWVVALCRLVQVYQHSRDPYCLHHQGNEALMMEAVQTSETLVNSYDFAWHYNPEDSHLPL